MELNCNDWLRTLTQQHPRLWYAFQADGGKGSRSNTMSAVECRKLPKDAPLWQVEDAEAPAKAVKGGPKLKRVSYDGPNVLGWGPVLQGASGPLPHTTYVVRHLAIPFHSIPWHAIT